MQFTNERISENYTLNLTESRVGEEDSFRDKPSKARIREQTTEVISTQ